MEGDFITAMIFDTILPSNLFPTNYLGLLNYSIFIYMKYIFLYC